MTHEGESVRVRGRGSLEFRDVRAAILTLVREGKLPVVAYFDDGPVRREGWTTWNLRTA